MQPITLTLSKVSLVLRNSLLPARGPTSAPGATPIAISDSTSENDEPEKPPRDMRNYFRHAAHKTTVVACPIDFACRAVDWSLDGKWCVGVGDHGMIAIFGRWLDK